MVVKTMNLEMSKHFIIWNEVSTMVFFYALKYILCLDT